MPLVLCLCCAELSSAVSPDTPFMQQGRHVKAALTKTGLKWQYCSMKLWPTQPANGSSESGNVDRCDQRSLHQNDTEQAEATSKQAADMDCGLIFTAARAVPYTEMLTAQQLDPVTSCTVGGCPQTVRYCIRS